MRHDHACFWDEGALVEVRVPTGVKHYRWEPGVVLHDPVKGHNDVIVVAFHDDGFGQWECWAAARADVRERTLGR